MRAITSQLVKACFLTLLLSSVASCGFHLRGSESQQSSVSSLQALYIQGENRYDDLSAEIKRQARQQQMVIDDPASEWRLRILKDNIERQRITATQSVTNDEFLLRLQVEYRLSYKDQALEAIKLSREAIFQDNQDNAVSKANEENLILSELRQQIAEQMLQQIQIIAANPPECAPDETEAAATQ